MMQYPKRQAGMSMWSLLFVLGTLAFFLFLFFKLFSPYMSDFKVKTALMSLLKSRRPFVSVWKSTVRILSTWNRP
jgi:hypothetical protein